MSGWVALILVGFAIERLMVSFSTRPERKRSRKEVEEARKRLADAIAKPPKTFPR